MQRSFLSILLGLAAAYAAQPTATVDLGYAEYEGSVNHQTGNIEFLGIRYAAAPTGSLRWREPQQPQKVSGIQQANTHPDTCWQTGAGIAPVTPFPTRNSHHQKRDSPPPSEDCLFLNVATPVNGNGSLPVVVWIHGGGYMGRSAFGFEPGDLIHDAGGSVVGVAIQYRLGVFGFLSSQKVHDGGVLNAGLLDQRFALQWVQSHISKFGGDPNKVTIWGESAGAGSVLQHIVADDGNTQPPLFHAAITSSTFLPSQYAFNDPFQEQLFSEVVNGTGCSSVKDALECLRQVDVTTLQEVNGSVGNSSFFGTFIFVPVVDGKLIPRRPTQILRDGRVNGKAFLAMTNTFEGALFVDPGTASSVQVPEYLVNLFPRFGKAQVQEGTALYAKQGAPIDQAIGIMGESIFICPTYLLLRAFKGKGFKGEFAIPPGGHAQDIVYYFPSFPSEMIPGGVPPFNNPTFINNFAQSFLNFAMNLDPNVKWDPKNTVPRWARWNEEDVTEMLFNKTDSGEPVFHSIRTSGDLLERCDFWESVSAITAQ
ncbi:hypothetical protein D9756_005128 [Leucocoprinus leucothites]|uniref:Carboxylic ester hydrolase n=1 Tax=Leucocoprinus leucothites TaxID=201217 RepID=A0A8H5LKN2_9AGAR|nr:hypothetical protein D9756_005128 [Leucoagaricus leucothites]